MKTILECIITQHHESKSEFYYKLLLCLKKKINSLINKKGLTFILHEVCIFKTHFYIINYNFYYLYENIFNFRKIVLN